MNDSILMRRAWAAVVLAVAVIAAFGIVARHPQWISDSFGYAVRLLVDRGESLDSATAHARVFFATDPVAKTSVIEQNVKGPSPEFGFVWSLWKPRVLYSWFASLLYPWQGLYALLDISTLAYVLAAIAIYFLAGEFCAPWLAAVCTCGVILSPEVLYLGESAATDISALLWWTLTLTLMCRIARGAVSTWIWFCALFAACLALEFTRPDAYLPFAAAFALAVAGLLARERTQVYRGLALTGLTGLAGVALMAVSLAEQVPGPAATMAYLHAHAIKYFHQPASEPLGSWYVHTVMSMVVIQVKDAVRWVAPVAAIVGIWLRRDHPAVPLLVGAIVGSLLVILIHPVRDDLVRVIDAPLYPVVAAGVALLVSFALTRITRSLRLPGSDRVPPV